MQNGNSKNDLLNEIVNLSNADLDLMIDTSKFKNIMKDFGGTNEFTPEKMKSSNNINFNTHQALSSNKPENSENQKQEKNEENNNEEKKQKNSIFDEVFDEADDILNNFNKNLQKNNNNRLLMNKSQSANLDLKLKPISEEKEKKIENNEFKIEEEKNEEDKKEENKKEGKKEEIQNNDKNKININNIEIGNKKENDKNKMISLKSCQFNKEENKKSLGSIFDMLDTNNTDNEKRVNHISSQEQNEHKPYENINGYNKEINTIEEKKEEVIGEKEDNESNSSISLDKEKYEEKKENNEQNNIKDNEEQKEEKIIEKEKNIKKEEIINKNEKEVKEIKEEENNENNNENEQKNLDIEENIIQNNNIIENKNKDKDIKPNDNKEDNMNNNKINIIHEEIKNDTNKNNEENELNKEPEIEYTGTKIDLVEKMENLSFSKNKNIPELKKYLNNKIYTSLDSDKNITNLKNEKIYYDITQSFPKNKLLTEFFIQKITALYLDSEEFIYCGDEKGNLKIYSIKEEKLVKEIENPFLFENKNNKKPPCINVITSDDQFIIAGYEKGKFALFLKNEKKPVKTKLYDAFQEVSQHNIIEIKIYSKKKNSILIYSCDEKENIYRTKIIKNKIFKNTVTTNRITGGLKNVKKKEPYYYLEINPFWYKCIGVLNNRSAYIYIIKKCKKDVIFKLNNLDEDNSYLSMFFSQKNEEKNKFFISNVTRINIYEINDGYDGVAQQKSIILEKNIIKIGYFMNDLMYVFDQKNNIKLINYNNIKYNETNYYGYYDTISLNNNEVVKEQDKENFKFLLNYQNFLCVKNGSMFIYNKNNILFINSLDLIDGITKLYDSIFITQNIEKWDILFKIGIEIYNQNHPLWKIDKNNRYQELYMNYSQSFLSLLIIQLCNNNDNKKYDHDKIINKFNELISFLFKVNFYNFITNEKNNLYSIFLSSKLEDFYFYLLEPHIIEDKFKDKINIPTAFINNLMDIYLNKKNKDNKFIKVNKSWLSELLTHFDIKKYVEGKNNGLLENIKENYLINTIIYYILNYNSNEVMANNLIDYNTPLNLLIRLLKLNIKHKQKNENKEQEGEEGLEINLKNENIFKKENRYKDEIVFSSDYLRIKIIWYIYKILKNKILNDNEEKTNEMKKSLFVKEILKIPLDKELFNNIVFASYNKDNKKCVSLDREIIYILHIIFENEKISKYHDFTKEAIFHELIHLFKDRKESQISLNLLLVKSIINDKGIDLSNDIKLNLVLFFMENNCSNSDLYPEIKEEKFQDNLIEILKLIDSYTFDDTEKLNKLISNCENNYGKLVTYIKANFKN